MCIYSIYTVCMEYLMVCQILPKISYMNWLCIITVVFVFFQTP